jgi:hypothetical protein
MKSVCLLLLASALCAQIATIGLKPEHPHQEEHSHAAAPVAGYLLSPGSNEIFPLFASSKAVKLGEAFSSPSTIKRLYLPPRQQYALAEQESGPVAVWSLRSQNLVVIPGALPHPDSVTFSPRGDSALLYSQASLSLEVITHLPAEPVITKSLTLPFPAFEKLAVSDDGEVVVALLPGGRLVLASGAPVQTSFSARALSFIPKTHSLAIVDTVQKMLLELPDVESSRIAYRVLAQNVDADQLMPTRGGEQILAANLNRGEIWTIDLRSGQVSQNKVPGSISTLLSLRDGYTFLLSQPQGLSLMRLAEATH